MSRKPKKGYYVRGEFVAEGSELDLELKRELKGTSEASRTELKRESTELQKLGEELLTLRADLMNGLDVPEKLRDALADARRITNFEGKRRQMQFVGKLMRQLEPDTLAAVRAALQEQHQGSAQLTLALHRAEQWRDRLIAEGRCLRRLGAAVCGHRRPAAARTDPPGTQGRSGAGQGRRLTRAGPAPGTRLPRDLSAGA
jgi:ribosome-associated protein